MKDLAKAKRLPKTGAERARKLRAIRRLKELCFTCGGPLGLTGTKTLCRPCADEMQDKAALRRAPPEESEFNTRQLDRIKDGLSPVVITGPTEDVP